MSSVAVELHSNATLLTMYFDSAAEFWFLRQAQLAWAVGPARGGQSEVMESTAYARPVLAHGASVVAAGMLVR